MPVNGVVSSHMFAVHKRDDRDTTAIQLSVVGNGQIVLEEENKIKF